MVRRIFMGLALVVTGVLFALSALLHPAPRPGARIELRLADNIASTAPSGVFSISGSVGGLYPGHTVSLPLVITNPNASPIRVEHVEGKVSVDQPKCDPTSISMPPVDNPFVVPAHASQTLPIPVTMLRTATDPCRSASYAFRLAGMASEVGGSPSPANGGVGASPKAHGGRLPATGGRNAAEAAAGLVLVMAGAVLLLATRCRSEPRTAP